MENNPLYPIFLKLHELPLLIVGAGNVGLEKLQFLLKNSPQAKVSVVAQDFLPKMLDLCQQHAVPYKIKPYEAEDLNGFSLVLAATNNRACNKQIRQDAKGKGLLVNVADTPDLCDFYLGAIVSRGPIKVAISTNGASPTLAKRLREFLEELLTDDFTELAFRLNRYRHNLKGSFQHKVHTLNKLTASLTEKE